MRTSWPASSTICASRAFPNKASAERECRSARRGSLDLHIFEVTGLVVDADDGRRDPAGEFARLALGLHQRGDEVAVLLRGQPLVLALLPGRFVDQFTRRRCVHIAGFADLPVEGD